MPGSLSGGAGSASGQPPDSPPSKRVRRQGEEGSPERSEVAAAASAGIASRGAGKSDDGAVQMDRCVEVNTTVLNFVCVFHCCTVVGRSAREGIYNCFP